MERTTSRLGQRWRSFLAGLTMAVGVVGFIVPAIAQVQEPDLSACKDADKEAFCKSPSSISVCTTAGYSFKLLEYKPAAGANSGAATYTYEICNPNPGVCSGDGVTSCLSNEQCAGNVNNPGPGGTCTRSATHTDKSVNTCVVESVKGLGLSHFDVDFPNLGADTCLGDKVEITGTCAVSKDTAPLGTSVQSNVVLGDGSCFDAKSSVAKCDNTQGFGPGDCITMTFSIAGEKTSVGLGTAVVVDKEGKNCESSCLPGPSCDKCAEEPPGGACLTRTIGFWGTHPWITNDYATTSAPVTVCGQPLSCGGGADAHSYPACLAGSCDSVMEGLGSVGGEDNKNAAYIGMVKQLTAAKLNLAATKALVPGSTDETNCTDFKYPEKTGKTIQEWIGYCESLCSKDQATISSSGCIEALNAFNNLDGEIGFAQTPAPFDRPSVDDNNLVAGADSSNFTLAQGNSTPPGKLVIGKNIKNGAQCVKQ